MYLDPIAEQKYYAEYRRKYRKEINAKARDQYRKNPDIERNRNLRRKFGITLEQKKQMYEQQQGVCVLCGRALPEDFNKCQTDHNHKTGKVRKLLHSSCNVKLGVIEDVEFKIQAETYLRLNE